MNIISRVLCLIAFFNYNINLHANVIIPSIVTLSGIYKAYSGALILVILLVKFLCFYIAIPGQLKRVILAVLCMNLGSATMGLILKVLFDFILSGLFGGIAYYFSLDETITIIARNLTVGSLPGGDILYGIIYFFSAIAINVLIEGFIAVRFFPNISRKRIYGTTLIANIFGVGIGLLGLGYYRYTHAIERLNKF